MADAVRQIERLRSFRQSRERDLSIASEVRATADSAAAVHRRLGEVIDLWQSVIPPALSAHSRILALRGSILHVAVDSASVLYEIDQHLRMGLESELRRRFRASLSRVRLRLES